MGQNTPNMIADQNIYVGIDVHKKSWTVNIRTDHFEHKTFTQPPQPEALVHYLRRHFPGATYYAVYEAGFSGFWIHDRLWEAGIHCIVVHPADIPTSDKERRRKNDPRDARKQSRSLRNGDLKPIYVPTPKELEDRSLVRLRGTIAKEQRRIKNRIKSFLYFHGIPLPVEFDNHYWSGAFIKWLEAVEMHNDSGKNTLCSLLDQLRYYRKEQANITRKIKALAQTEHYCKAVGRLMSLPGIGLISAMVWLTELMDIHRFKRFDHWTSYVGLVPREHTSGENKKVGRLEHRGNKILRTILIENSWVMVRKDPQLIRDYHHYTRRMTGRKAIIRIARKVLRRIRFVLVNEKEYVMQNV